MPRFRIRLKTRFSYKKSSMPPRVLGFPQITARRLAGAEPLDRLALIALTAQADLYSLLRITGIPATEAQALRSRGDDCRDYQRTTNAFLPWFPKQ